jgi:hypothetical protein
MSPIEEAGLRGEVHRMSDEDYKVAVLSQLRLVNGNLEKHGREIHSLDVTLHGDKARFIEGLKEIAINNRQRLNDHDDLIAETRSKLRGIIIGASAAAAIGSGGTAYALLKVFGI